MTVDPSCPATPNGSGRVPNRSQMTRPVMTAAGTAATARVPRCAVRGDDELLVCRQLIPVPGAPTDVVRRPELFTVYRTCLVPADTPTLFLLR